MIGGLMAKKPDNFSPRINNRRALHDYFIEAKLECGIALQGSEVKSLRLGNAQLTESFARIEKGELILHNAHIDPYKAATVYNHEPMRERKLLVHKKELRKLESELKTRGTTLIPLAMYFKDGRVKVELGVARGKQQHDNQAKRTRPRTPPSNNAATIAHLLGAIPGTLRRTFNGQHQDRQADADSPAGLYPRADHR
jgi:SsrA-binding protein